MDRRWHLRWVHFTSDQLVIGCSSDISIYTFIHFNSVCSRICSRTCSRIGQNNFFSDSHGFKRNPNPDALSSFRRFPQWGLHLGIQKELSGWVNQSTSMILNLNVWQCWQWLLQMHWHDLTWSDMIWHDLTWSDMWILCSNSDAFCFWLTRHRHAA